MSPSDFGSVFSDAYVFGIGGSSDSGKLDYAWINAGAVRQ